MVLWERPAEPCGRPSAPSVTGQTERQKGALPAAPAASSMGEEAGLVLIQSLISEFVAVPGQSDSKDSRASEGCAQ